jgi:predicted nucleotidyltransferase
MRLTEHDRLAIIQTFKEYFHDGDRLWLFGSRVDDNKRGGDIDLYIEIDRKNIESLFNLKIKFLGALQDRIGDQKIDIVINTPEQPHIPIYDVARTEGIRLV